MNENTPPLPRIESVTIRGFRSLANVDNLKLPQLTVLIGANGSGKSNFIRFFHMLSEMLYGHNLQRWVALNGGGDDQLFMGARTTPKMDAEISIETPEGFSEYRFSLEHATAGDKLVFVDEACRFRYSHGAASALEANWHGLHSGGQEVALLSLIQPPKIINVGVVNPDTGKVFIRPHKSHIYAAGIIIKTLRYGTVFQFHDTSDKAYVRLSWDVTDNAWLRPDGGNLAPILLKLQEVDIARYKLIVKQIGRVLPSFDDFVLQPNGPKVQLRWRGKYSDKTFGTHLTSDGSLRLFCLLTLLNLPQEMLPEVIFLDEPELGLHPHAISLVSTMLKRLSHKHQVIIATQSPYMVDCFNLESIVVADLEGGATVLKNLTREQYQQWLDDEYHVSDLWLKDVIGGTP